MKRTLLFIAISIMVHLSLAQENAESRRNRDIIVTTEGQIIQCLVKEVTELEVKYMTVDMRENGPTFSIPAVRVYAINYSSGTTQFITARLNGRKVSALSSEPDTTWNYLTGNAARGVLRVGFGFIKSHSSWDNMDDFDARSTSPGLNIGYHFQVSRVLYAGALVSFGNYEYSRRFNSPYDALIIDQRVKESLWAIGLFARYDLSQTFLRPYLLAGVNLVFSNGTIVSDLSTNTSINSVRSEVPVSGFQPAVIARGGLDLRLSSRFGIYGDIGSGLQLIQLGILFIFED